MTDDLVTRLSETLDEVEGLAVAARALCWDPRGNCVIADDGNPATPLVAHVPNRGSRDHIARWDPQAVLRLVAAHREVIKAYEGALRTQKRDPTNAANTGYILGISRAIYELAVGWGLSDG